MKNFKVFLVFFIILSLCPAVLAETFSDVASGDEYAEAISYLSDKKIITGYDDGTFKPNNGVTRAEMCVLISRTQGYEKGSGNFKKLEFSDVFESYWAYDYISYTFDKKIVSGMGDGSFLPAGGVTYEQAVKMIVCAIGKESEALRIGGAKWYTGYLEAAHRANILSGVRIVVGEGATRGDIAALLYNAYKNGYINSSNSSVSDNPVSDKPVSDKPVSGGETEKPPTAAENPSTADKKEIKKIVIDPGHNFEGYDKGARNEDGTIAEELITWRISNKLKTFLENDGYEVLITRETEKSSIANSSVTESLRARCDLANDANADLFISVHCNTGGGTGCEVYCFSTGSEGEKLAKVIEKNIIEKTGLYSRGVKTAGFYVIKNTVMPSVLIETGFIDNKNDAELLNSEAGQEKIAKAVAEAVNLYRESL